MKKRNLTQWIFWSALTCAATSGAAVLVAGPWAVAFAVASVAFTVWAILRSESRGFMRTTQLRRAYEPARRFSALQVGVLLAITMAQLCAAMYALVGSPG